MTRHYRILKWKAFEVSGLMVVGRHRFCISCVSALIVTTMERFYNPPRLQVGSSGHPWKAALAISVARPTSVFQNTCEPVVQTPSVQQKEPFDKDPRRPTANISCTDPCVNP